MVNRFLIQQLSLPNDSHLNPYFTNISLISPIFLVMIQCPGDELGCCCLSDDDDNNGDDILLLKEGS